MLSPLSGEITTSIKDTAMVENGDLRAMASMRANETIGGDRNAKVPIMQPRSDRPTMSAYWTTEPTRRNLVDCDVSQLLKGYLQLDSGMITQGRQGNESRVHRISTHEQSLRRGYSLGALVISRARINDSLGQLQEASH